MIQKINGMKSTGWPVQCGDTKLTAALFLLMVSLYFGKEPNFGPV